jgi:hypothetical protein
MPLDNVLKVDHVDCCYSPFRLEEERKLKIFVTR